MKKIITMLIISLFIGYTFAQNCTQFATNWTVKAIFWVWEKTAYTVEEESFFVDSRIQLPHLKKEFLYTPIKNIQRYGETILFVNVHYSDAMDAQYIYIRNGKSFSEKHFVLQYTIDTENNFWWVVSNWQNEKIYIEKNIIVPINNQYMYCADNNTHQVSTAIINWGNIEYKWNIIWNTERYIEKKICDWFWNIFLVVENWKTKDLTKNWEILVQNTKLDYISNDIYFSPNKTYLTWVWRDIDWNYNIFINDKLVATHEANIKIIEVSNEWDVIYTTEKETSEGLRKTVWFFNTIAITDWYSYINYAWIIWKKPFFIMHNKDKNGLPQYTTYYKDKTFKDVFYWQKVWNKLYMLKNNPDNSESIVIDWEKEYEVWDLSVFQELLYDIPEQTTMTEKWYHVFWLQRILSYIRNANTIQAITYDGKLSVLRQEWWYKEWKWVYINRNFLWNNPIVYINETDGTFYYNSIKENTNYINICPISFVDASFFKNNNDIQIISSELTAFSWWENIKQKIDRETLWLSQEQRKILSKKISIKLNTLAWNTLRHDVLMYRKSTLKIS